MSTLFDPTHEPRDDRPDHTTEPAVEPAGESAVEPAGESARRPSVLHLVVGLVFLGLAALWALSASGTVSSEDTWLFPGLLVVAGAAGLVAALAGGRRRTR
jgi:peptidoglycan/LPS O-acetylase OafA/YrhL